MMEKAFRRILAVQVANTMAETMAWNFIYLHATQAGHSEAAIAVFFGAMFGFAALAAPLISRRVPTGRSMALGMGLRLVAFAVVVDVAWYGNLLAGAALHGAFIMLFWVPYNVVFMRMTSDADRAGRSTLLFAIFAVGSAVFPLVGGALMDWKGFWAVSVVGMVTLAVGGVVTARVPWGEPMEFRIRRAFREGGRITPLVGLEGLWQGIFWIVVPIGTLRMVDQSEEYGAFLAFLGLMAGVASIAAGRWSDRTRDRRWPLVVSGGGVAGFSLAVPLYQGDLPAWSLLVGTVYFFGIMFMAFTFTVVAEQGMTMDDAMGLREVMFNGGRVTGAFMFTATLLAGLDLFWPLMTSSLLVLAMLIGYLRLPQAEGTTATPPRQGPL